MRLLLTLIALIVAAPALAQDATKRNPSAVLFTCPDHAADTGHEVDIVNAQGQVVQTIQGGDPPADANGDVRVALNVQPIAFGVYTVKVRATYGAIKSIDSEASETWERAPGQPSKPRVP